MSHENCFSTRGLKLPALVVVISVVSMALGCSERSPAPPAPTAAPSSAAPPSVEASAVVASGIDLPSHTDANWVNGVARDWGAAIFVMNSPAATELFTAGREVTFSDGTKRAIIGTRVNGDTVIVDLEGAPLDGSAVGHPRKITVTKSKAK